MSATLKDKLKKLSSDFTECENLTIILAAGHGKRIKSNTSKMLHTIWGVPTVERVKNAVVGGIGNTNVIIVVGIKALDVADSVGKSEKTAFILQEEQLGTGHAVREALNGVVIPKSVKYCYVIYADMGLIDVDSMKQFQHSFIKSKTDMMALTGIFEGNVKDNYYGRIVRAKEFTKSGKKSKYYGDVIEIKEHKDILSITGNYSVCYRNEEFEYTKEELLAILEYNTGIYGFKMPYLLKYINTLDTNNAQGELYITDLLAIFNQEGLSIGAVSPHKMYVVLGFNNKSVLKEMEDIARFNIYQKLKDIVSISDPNDFFIDEEIVENILEMDSRGELLDIYIGKGVRIEKGVKLNYGLYLHKDVMLCGNIEFGRNVTVYDGAHIATFKNQKMSIGDNVRILHGDSIQGHIEIGANTVIERGVNITGSDEHNTIIGKNVVIKGVSYIYGCRVDDSAYIESSALYQKHIKCIYDKNGDLIKVKFVFPEAEGKEAISQI